jgi:tRNA (cmo5U34)-methyltransferase
MKTNDSCPWSGDFDSNPPVGVSQYDASIRQFTAAYEPVFAMAHAYLSSMLDEDADLLIAGAGTGMEICTFAQGSPEWSMTGVDPSGEMLSLAGKKIDRKGFSNQLRLIRGYVSELPEDHLYDGATCILVMHFLPDDGAKLQLLESIGRRLKSGSPFVLVDGFGEKDTETFDRTVEAWKTFVKARGVDPKTVEDGFSGQILKRLQFVPEERIEELLAEAGFEKPSRFYTGFLYGGWITTKK